MKRTVELGFIDHFLVLVACTSSLFALGESLSKHVLATLLAVSSVVSILCGYVLSRYLAKVNVKAFDGYLWAGLALAAAVLAFPLNRLLPEEGFPFQLFAGTWLSFMVVFCGFVSWRDQTLLFLNLPCISVFALVGTFDTFAPATALFFVFIVCSSLLYSRIHKRSMILRAAQAGHKDVGLLDRDAWRWMAGPEWAVGSAGLIVIFSLIFGPILRFSLQPVSGTLKMSLPTTPTTMSTQGNATISDVQIGRGPITLSDQVLFRLRVIEPSVLRTATFVRYQGNGWSRNTGRPFARIFGQPVSSAGGNNKWVVAWPDGAPVEPLPKVPVAEFELLGPTSPQIVVPAPGPVIGMSSHFEFPCQFFPSGLVFSETTLNEGQSVKFRYSRPAPGSDPGPAQLPDSYEQIKESFLDIGKVPDSVIVFVNRTIRGLSNDYEKAVALQNAISNLAAYSLKPDPQDPARDAIEQFLFERKVGYCDLFATSLAVCARIAGLPSRYAVGYLIDPESREPNGSYKVKSRDAHAWTEIYFKNHGWVSFDATEGARVIDDPHAGLEDNRPWYQKPFAPLVTGAIAMAVLGLTYLLVKFRPQNHRRTTGRDSLAADEAQKSLDRLLRARTGKPRKFSQTGPEFVQAASPFLGNLGPEFMSLQNDIDRASYFPAGPDTVEVKVLVKRVKTLGRALLNEPRP